MIKEIMSGASGTSGPNGADLCIVGGGVAGLTMALRLLDKAQMIGLPVPKITIIEGGSEPGGRTKTVMLANGANASSGAQWFHGGRTDPFYGWARAA
jgi:glycine/D-amino acid oxidase-like deaminating enzyme